MAHQIEFIVNVKIADTLFARNIRGSSFPPPRIKLWYV
jgi:hypothetical protein